MGHENAATFAQTREKLNSRHTRKWPLKWTTKWPSNFTEESISDFSCLGIRQLVGGFKHLDYFP